MGPLAALNKVPNSQRYAWKEHPMNTLYFEKISQFDRAAEPVMVSIPY